MNEGLGGRVVRQKRSSASEVRDRLRAAAALRFDVYGYHAANWASIFKDAGLTNGSAYHAVPGGKIELALEIYRQFSDDLRRELAPATGRRQQSLEDFLAKELLRRYVGWFTQKRGRAAFMFEMETLTPPPEAGEDLMMGINEAKGKLQDLICLLLASVKDPPPQILDWAKTPVEMLVLGPARLALAGWVTSGATVDDPTPRLGLLGAAVGAALRVASAEFQREEDKKRIVRPRRGNLAGA